MRIWYNNGKEEKLIEEGLDIPNGFIQGRILKLKKIDYLKEKFSKEEIYEYYILKNHKFNETFEHFNITRSELRMLLKYYNIFKDYDLRGSHNKVGFSHEKAVANGKKSSATQKENWKKKSQEEKDAWSEKLKKAKANMSREQIAKWKENLSNAWWNKTQEERDAQCKKLSEIDKIVWQDLELVKKNQEAIKQNRKLRGKSEFRSLEEEKIFKTLIKCFPDTKYDIIVDDRYKHICDFYIKSLDLFIEYQGHPSHGKVPYVENDKEALRESNKLKGEWLYTYTIRDVIKYNDALKSEINLIRIYPQVSYEKNLEINNNLFPEIIKLILNSIK